MRNVGYFTQKLHTACDNGQVFILAHSVPVPYLYYVTLRYRYGHFQGVTASNVYQPKPSLGTQ